MDLKINFQSQLNLTSAIYMLQNFLDKKIYYIWKINKKILKYIHILIYRYIGKQDIRHKEKYKSEKEKEKRLVDFIYDI